MSTITAIGYGVTADSGQNMIEYLRRAFDACRGTESPTIQLGGGTVHVWDQIGLDSFEAFLGSGTYRTADDYWPPEFRIAIDLHDIDNLTVDGQGATLMMHGFTQPFRFSNCNNLKIKNLKIDWARPPYSVATVVSCELAEVRVRVWSDFPWKEAMSIHIMGEYDPSLTHTEREYSAVSARKLSDREAVITLDREAAIAKGQIPIIRHTTAATASHCTGLCVQFPFLPHTERRGVSQQRPRPGSPRLR